MDRIISIAVWGYAMGCLGKYWSMVGCVGFSNVSDSRGVGSWYVALTFILLKKEDKSDFISCMHSEKSPARPMLFYSTNYWQQFRVQFVV